MNTNLDIFYAKEWVEVMPYIKFNLYTYTELISGRTELRYSCEVIMRDEILFDFSEKDTFYLEIARAIDIEYEYIIKQLSYLLKLDISYLRERILRYNS